MIETYTSENNLEIIGSVRKILNPLVPGVHLKAIDIALFKYV